MDIGQVIETAKQEVEKRVIVAVNRATALNALSALAGVQPDEQKRKDALAAVLRTN